MNARTLLFSIAVGLAACSNPEAPKVVQSLDLIAPKQTIGVGEAVQLIATPRDPNGVAISTVRVNYTSSAPSVANVGADGRVIGVAPGGAQIIATAGQITQSLTIQVNASNIAAVVLTLTDNTFSPPTTTVRVGQTVMWSFGQEPHNVAFEGTGRPVNIPISFNVDITRAFNTAGTFPYKCDIHPGMTGQVVVTP